MFSYKGEQAQRVATSVLVYFILLGGIFYPILQLLLSAFRVEKPNTPAFWSLANFINIPANQGITRALANTFIVCVEATALAVTLGVFLAWLVARTDMRFKRVLEPVNMIPFYLSNLVGAVGWEILAAPYAGLLNKAAQQTLGLSSPPFNIYSLTGMAVVMGLHEAPFVYLFTIGCLSNMDPSLEDAGRMSGASNGSTLFRITLPLAAPSIISAAILVFVLSASSFAVPLMLGGPKRIHTLSTFLYRYLEVYPPNYNAASALSTVLLVITVFLIILQTRILARRHFWTITGKGFRPRLIRLGRWQGAALGANFTYLVVVLLPVIALLLVSFFPRWVGGFNFKGFGWGNYITVIINNDVTQRGLINSSIIGVAGASLGVGAALLLAGIILRTKLPGRSGIDFLAMSPVVFPGIVLGLGFLVAWIKTPLYGTLWILIFAYVVHFLPTALRSTTATLGGISPELDECARICGAGWFGTLGRILLPLMWPGIISAWLMLFVIFMREVSTSMMLYVHGTETISIALIQLHQYGGLGPSAAFSILLTVIILAGVFIVRRLASAFKIQMEADEVGQ